MWEFVESKWQNNNIRSVNIVINYHYHCISLWFSNLIQILFKTYKQGRVVTLDLYIWWYSDCCSPLSVTLHCTTGVSHLHRKFRAKKWSVNIMGHNLTFLAKLTAKLTHNSNFLALIIVNDTMKLSNAQKMLLWGAPLEHIDPSAGQRPWCGVWCWAAGCWGWCLWMLIPFKMQHW